MAPFACVNGIAGGVPSAPVALVMHPDDEVRLHEVPPERASKSRSVPLIGEELARAAAAAFPVLQRWMSRRASAAAPPRVVRALRRHTSRCAVSIAQPARANRANAPKREAQNAAARQVARAGR